MKLITVIILFLFNLNIAHTLSNAEDSETILDNVRKTYYSGVENERYVDSLTILINKYFGADTSSYSPVVLAYYAGVEALKSKHAFWPFTKMTHLNNSMELFQKSISKDPDNLEIRFMRFSILFYVPGILGYNEDKMNDLITVYNLLLDNNYENIDFGIQSGMAEFLIRTELLEVEKENKLKAAFNIAESNE